MTHRPLALVIIDGWGLSPRREGNAIALARTPVVDGLMGRYPSGRLWAHGEHVGLSPGQMGNSNVGHLNLGAGRVVLQELGRITRAIDDRSFFTNAALSRAMDIPPGRVLHIYGLVSDGGVHSHVEHLEALLEMAAMQDVKRLRVHAITDGRDTAPSSAGPFIDRLEAALRREGHGRDWGVATVMGRYWAMDRDRRWDRIAAAYSAMVHGRGRRAGSAIEAVRSAYQTGETDEFIAPTVIAPPGALPVTLSLGDSVIALNFRADRARQMAGCMGLSGAPIGEGDPSWRLTTFSVYDPQQGIPAAFPPELVEDSVGELVSRAGFRQLRLAETEKYAHVTYFYSGGREEPFAGEDRVMIPSPHVSTYDLKPEMSAEEVTDAALDAIASRDYDFMVMNYANPDMVGHTGILDATVLAVETVDRCLGRLVPALTRAGYRALVLSDHGNAEQVSDPQTGGPITAHTTNPVPVIVVDPDVGPSSLGTGILADAGPTVLDLLGLEPPPKMTARSLLRGERSERLC